MNPTDAYRKLQRKKEVQKNKKERRKVREFSAMVRNPDLMVEEVSVDPNSTCTSIGNVRCLVYSKHTEHWREVMSGLVITHRLVSRLD